MANTPEEQSVLNHVAMLINKAFEAFELKFELEGFCKGYTKSKFIISHSNYCMIVSEKFTWEIMRDMLETIDMEDMQIMDTAIYKKAFIKSLIEISWNNNLGLYWLENDGTSIICQALQI